MKQRTQREVSESTEAAMKEIRAKERTPELIKEICQKHGVCADFIIKIAGWSKRNCI